MMTDLIRVDIDGGKYTVVQVAGSGTRILRYGEPWIGQDGGFPGVNCVLAMAYELEELRALRETTRSALMDAMLVLRQDRASDWVLKNTLFALEEIQKTRKN